MLCSHDGDTQLMSTIDVFQLVMEAVILLLLFYLAFLKSYFQEKGKNLATTQDIEEITSLVESVKSQLQFSLQAKLSLRAEAHQALVDYFSKYSAWLAAISDCSFVGIDEDNASRLSEMRSRLDAHHRDVDLAAGKMELFVENEDIRAQHGTLMIETLKFQAHAQRATFEFERIQFEVRQMKLSTPAHEQIDRYRELHERVEKLYQHFKEEQLQMYRALFPLAQQQRRMISAQIKALANQGAA
jgi:hypothetical protein